MNETIKKYIEPIKSFWGNLTKKKRIIILSVFAGVVVLSIVISSLLNVQPFVVLYPGLDHAEAVEVMTELKTMDISYKEDNGTISVPKDKENALRMQLSNEGHPKTAPNYDFFTKNISVMSTDYEKKTIEKYQLNTRLEAVIKTISGINNANVTISIPDESTYAWDTTSSPATASVSITLESGKTLQATQINGIKQLVAKSVPNLKVENVALVDTATGDELSASDNSTQVDISQFKLTIEKAYENDIEKSVLKVLNPVFGESNVKVTAKSIMDVDKKVQEIITYTPSADNKGVISDETTNKEQSTNGTSSTGGTTGTQSNSTVPSYPGVTVNGNVIYTKDNQTYKYLVSQVKEQIQGDAASVKDMTISVVVNKATMDDTQKQQITQLVANAAAIDAGKVIVYSTAFSTPATVPAIAPVIGAPTLNQILIYGGAALATLLVVVIIVLISVARKRKKKRKKLMGAETEAEGEVPEDFYELKGVGVAANEKVPAEKAVALKAIEETRAAENSQQDALKKEIRDFSSQNPEIAAQLIRSWLRGEDYNG